MISFQTESILEKFLLKVTTDHSSLQGDHPQDPDRRAARRLHEAPVVREGVPRGPLPDAAGRGVQWHEPQGDARGPAHRPRQLERRVQVSTSLMLFMVKTSSC